MYLLSTMHFYSFLMRIYIHVDDTHMQKYYNLTLPLWKKNKIWKCTSHMKMYARPNFIAYTTKIPVVLIYELLSSLKSILADSFSEVSPALY